MNGQTNQRLIPANTTLLQPGARYFTIKDMDVAISQTQAIATKALAANTTNITTLQNQMTVVNNAIAQLQQSVANLGGSVSNIEGEITTIQGQITTINSDIAAITDRLNRAGIPP